MFLSQFEPVSPTTFIEHLSFSDNGLPAGCSWNTRCFRYIRRDWEHRLSRLVGKHIVTCNTCLTREVVK